MKHLVLSVLFSFVVMCGAALAEPDAAAIVQGAFDYWRGNASESVTDMTIHRTQWERKMSIRAWTLGESESLFIITSPARDKGNGTLKNDKGMWVYNPKVNRVIKLPPSMMNQSWQGSDFSNNDLAKSDTLIHDYVHTLSGEEMHETQKVYVITSMPKPDAPVIWGMLRLKIREDHILLQEEFFDEDKKPVKIMTATDIRSVDGRLFPMHWVMKKSDTPEEYTLLDYSELSFKDALDPRLFSLPSFKNTALWK
jgi:outer membrane lipoprotein-sorting protein